MEVVFSSFRILHIVAGFVALFLFWIPIVTKKGGRVHNSVGWSFVIAMALVAVSALFMGSYRIFFDSDADSERISFSWFLIFISILSGTSSWYGLRVLRYKNRKNQHRNIIDLFASCLLLASGISISIYGISIGSSLLTYFPILGLFLGIIQLNYWLRKTTKKMHWYFEHFGGMFACSISTVTAFAVFGAPKLLQISSSNIFLWLAPTFVLVPILIGFKTYYERKFHKGNKNSKSENKIIQS
ncbi:DUF2306 domain-containing protein [Bacillus sp. 1P10SD]|uniref:DUF2306 domain-containing protein n=1 Tax=Bacillus sp. 1P10SD TaxID=3132265 RepID=UPI0039A542A5